MLTILVKIDGSNERIYQGTDVSWHECTDTECPLATGLTIHDRDAVVAAFSVSERASYMIYVMNDKGATVGTYHIPAINVAALSNPMQALNQSQFPLKAS